MPFLQKPSRPVMLMRLTPLHQVFHGFWPGTSLHRFGGGIVFGGPKKNGGKAVFIMRHMGATWVTMLELQLRLITTIIIIRRRRITIIITLMIIIITIIIIIIILILWSIHVEPCLHGQLWRFVDMLLFRCIWGPT